MTTRLVGTCPVCERHQKVTAGGAMVHHGFKRPGWGSIVGDCFGVGYQAYELSSDGCAAYRDALVEWRRNAEDTLRRYEARPDEVTSYSQVRQKSFTYRRDNPEERHKYEDTLRALISQTRYSISAIDMSHKRMIELIANWAPAPLIEIDEEGLTPAKRGERDARRGERDAKRAEKDSKQAAFLAKRNERLARKSTALLFFFDEFERLAKQPPGAARDTYARDLIFESAKKKHGLNYPWDLMRGPGDGHKGTPGPWGWSMLEHAEQTLIDLGVARREGKRAYPIPVFKSSGKWSIRVPEPTAPAEEVLDTIARMAPP